jgi:hypothetical protein
MAEWSGICQSMVIAVADTACVYLAHLIIKAVGKIDWRARIQPSVNDWIKVKSDWK